jgi:general secretion pathway protein E
MKTIININPKKSNTSFNIKEGIKFSLLPGILDDKEYFFTTKENLIDALNFYNKLSSPLEIIITDNESFNRLLNQYLDVTTQKELQESPGWQLR